MPLSIVKGGQSANVLVKTMESEWGKKLYSRTLVSNIAQAVYKVRVLPAQKLMPVMQP